MKQDYLRKEVKLAKALNDDIFYKDFAESIDIAEHSFYNWLNGEYELSYQKERYLHDIVYELSQE